ncbi:MAG: ABC transporter ATP-binding protein [Euryarchaeota archaeon]|nr:ABC transporter ATP-binding protein [Euryarchaeota archaeon]
MIEVSGLTRRFGEVTAVEDLTLSVKAGECFGLLGPNGAGKTTTVRMLCALIAPTSGTARVAGVDLTQPGQGAKVRGSIGLLPENPGLYESLSPRENLAFYAELYRIPRDVARKRIEELLDRLDLAEDGDRPTAPFSKGMKQKVALARALLHHPKVLFLDEPTSGLDPFSGRVVKDVLLGLKREGTTIFLSTHNLPEAEELCDRVGVLRKRLLVVGPPRELPRRLPRRGANFRWRPGFRPDEGRLLALPGVGSVRLEEGGAHVALAMPDEGIPRVVQELVRQGAELSYAAEELPTLEEAYLQIIGGAS